MIGGAAKGLWGLNQCGQSCGFFANEKLWKLRWFYDLGFPSKNLWSKLEELCLCWFASDGVSQSMAMKKGLKSNFKSPDSIADSKNVQNLFNPLSEAPEKTTLKWGMRK